VHQWLSPLAHHRAHGAPGPEVFIFVSTCRYASSPAFLGIGLLNEPTSRWASVEFLQQYYTAAYQAVRRHAPCAYVTVGLPIDSGR